ncbi:MAG: M43 family zinc metalloprotease [Bacteroidota bacterium]
MTERSTGKVLIQRTVPTVVHVIYRRENDAHNISDAQIESQFPILNNDFAGVFGGTDTEIQFCLAGIRRIRSRDHYQVKRGTNDVQAKALSQAPPQNYLNIWVVDEIRNQNNNPVLGFAQLPNLLAVSPQTDGIMVADEFFGDIGTAAGSVPYNLGRTTTHEVGHWLNLLHTHEPPGCDNPQNCFITGDCCCDTPPQAAGSYSCPVNLNSCNTDQPDFQDPVDNYMSYSDDACMTMFTPCQSDRMNLCLDSVRVTAWVPAGEDCPAFKIAASPQNPDLHPRVAVYPNPASGPISLQIILPETTQVSILMLNQRGKVVASIAERKLTPSGTTVWVLPDDLPAGVYLLRITMGELHRRKLIRIG